MRSSEARRSQTYFLIKMVLLISGSLVEMITHEARLKPAYLTTNQLVTDLRKFLVDSEGEDV